VWGVSPSGCYVTFASSLGRACPEKPSRPNAYVNQQGRLRECSGTSEKNKDEIAFVTAVNELGAGPSPSGRGWREALGEGRAKRKPERAKPK
jgi:hypothetical protein